MSPLGLCSRIVGHCYEIKLDLSRSRPHPCECAASNIFPFRAPLVAEKVSDGADHNREKDHHSSQDREGSPVHPGPPDHGKPLRPDRCVTQGVMRRRALGRRRCPGRKKTQNGHSNQKDKDPYVLENLHKEHSLHQAVAIGLIKSPAAHGRLSAKAGS